MQKMPYYSFLTCQKLTPIVWKMSGLSTKSYLIVLQLEKMTLFKFVLFYYLHNFTTICDHIQVFFVECTSVTLII